MVQVPAAMPVTWSPFTVQIVGVLDLKVTGRPEFAVALTVAVSATDSTVESKVMAPIVCGVLGAAKSGVRSATKAFAFP